MVHAECCGPTYADDCQNCQAGRFYLYYPAGHSPSEIAGLQAAVTRNTTDEAYPNTFLLSPGANFAINNPAHAAATAAAGHFRPPGPGVPGNANPGINGVDLAARLAELGRAAPTGPANRPASNNEASQVQESRQEQMRAYNGERRPPVFYNPSAAASGWIPPYSYNPVSSQIIHAPAIFAHPDYAYDHQFVQNPMDPPFAQEAMSQQTGIPLIQTQQTNNRYVREHVENMHHGSSYRSAAAGKGGDFVAAYNPIRPDGVPVQLPALGLAGTTNSFMSAELENIHRGQQAAMQRRAPRQNQKGKSKGKE